MFFSRWGQGKNIAYVSVLHTTGHGGREYLQRLPHHYARLQRVRFQQTVEHL